MEKKQRTEPYVLDDVDRISSWLRQATHEQYEDDMSELGQLTTIEPITPRRHPSLPTFYAEASPTDTAFSGHSVFDTPSSPGNGWIEDVFSDEVPDIIPGDDSKTRLDKEQKARLSKNQTLLDIDDSEAGSRVSCKRKGQAALCLLHRRQYPEEIRTSDATWCTTLKLLKLRSEDEETWKKKLELADELRHLNISQKDYKNWVLPLIESPRGDFRSYGTKIPKKYPSEGKGERMDKHSYQELCVALDCET
ncbi:hypothetical protein N0V87_003171 [Didymella glomerata]|uniref:Uncharacterized protein n=1 Tax=Didymella glomerata TaxID=749621 RepID=A0A9W9C1M2_9PLEO|nr:hypothetical protein N0V87_003171 [Didymella glomerata]